VRGAGDDRKLGIRDALVGGVDVLHRDQVVITEHQQRSRFDVPQRLLDQSWPSEIFGDEVTATAMIDRLVHHAEILSTNGTQPISLDGPESGLGGRGSRSGGGSSGRGS
jgi:hypothetical protein